MKQNAFFDSLRALGRFRFWRSLSVATILMMLGTDICEPAFSESSSAPELHVTGIQIEGNQLIPSEEILGALKTEKGDIFFREQLVEDLKAINKLGWFDESGSQIAPQLVDGAIVLKIVVEENPAVKRILFKGNKDVSEKELLPIFSEQLGKPQNIKIIGKAIDQIENRFRDQGYVLARVVDLKDGGNGNCIVVVDEGVIGEVEIEGGTTMKEYLQKHIKIKPGQIYNDRTLSNELKNMQADGFDMKLRRSLSASASDPSRYKLRVEQVYSDAPLVVAKGHAKPVFTATGSFTPAANSDSRPFKASSNGTNPLLDRLKRQRSSSGVQN